MANVAAPPATKAALYARISFDESGMERGVTRQIEDARALAAARGWHVAAEYVDNDVSAYSGAQRPGYERLMADAEARYFERIVVYQTSRLWRSRVERAGAIGLLGRLHISVAAVQGPELDLATAGGRMIAGVLGEFDTMESEVKGERVARAALQRAQEGRANGRAPYGWRREYQTDASGRINGFVDLENPHEADIVREIVDRLLAGDTMKGIAADLNRRGEPTPLRKPTLRWGHRTIAKLVLRSANVGSRLYKGEVIGQAAWPAIVDQAKYERVVALLRAPERRTQRDAARKHLLTFGIGECGVCGGPLRVKSANYYMCANKGCVWRVRRPVDELVNAVLVERLSRPDAASIFDSDDSGAAEAREEVEALRARLAGAADEYAYGNISLEQMTRINSRLRPELEAAEERLQRLQRPILPTIVDGLQGERAGAVWAELPVTAKRAVMRVLGLSVAIMPRNGRGPGFDPRDVVFRWGRE